MTVAIPISADASATVAAINRIQDALKRVGQEARAIRDIDLSHPELRGMDTDLQSVIRSLNDMLRVGRGETAAAMRRVAGPNYQVHDAASASTLLDRWSREVDRMFPDRAARNRHIGTVSQYVFGGTAFAPHQPSTPFHPQNPPNLPPRPSSPMSQQSLGGIVGTAVGGMVGGIPGALAAGALWMLGGAGIQSIGRMATEAVGNARDEAVGNDQLLRTVHGSVDDFNGLRDAVRATASAFYLTYNEAQRMSLAWAKITNETDQGKLIAGVGLAAGFARGYGLDPAATGAGFAKASYLGEDPKRFAQLLASTIGEGKMSGQAEQVMQALLHWSENASRILVTQTNVGDFAGWYGALNATKLPGFQGAAGEALLGQIDSTLRGGGGAGEASMAALYRGFAKRGITDPYEVQYHLEGGMFDKVGGSTVFDLARGQVNDMYQGMPRYMRLNAMSRMLGITMHQAERLDGMQPAAVNSMAGVFHDYDIDVSKLNPTAFNELSDLYSTPGGGSVDGITPQMEGQRKKALAHKNFTPFEIEKIRNAKTGEELSGAIGGALVAHGMDMTMGSSAQKAEADFVNKLTEAGTGLVPVLTGLKETTAQMVGVLGRLSTYLGDNAGSVASAGEQSIGGGVGSQAEQLLATGRGGSLGWFNRNIGRPLLGGGRGDVSGPLPAEVEQEIRQQARLAGVDEDHAVALFRAEDGPGVSSAGAFGYAQLMPGTAAELQRELGGDPNEWRTNVRMGMIYYQRQLRKFGGNYPAADAGYNAGPGGRGVAHFAETGDTSQLPQETRDYIARIGRNQAALRRSGTALPPGAAAPPAPRTANVRVNITPLTVTHRDQTGAPIGQEVLPTNADYEHAHPWGD